MGTVFQIILLAEAGGCIELTAVSRITRLAIFLQVQKQRTRKPLIAKEGWLILAAAKLVQGSL